jgi:capsular polysaccharide biosynthesis protein
MENKTTTKEYYTIDLIHIIKTLWQRAWLIALAGFMAAAIGFGMSSFVIQPTYSSSIMLYVNNTSFSLGSSSFSISASEINAAQSLVKTYGEILNNRTTLERVKENAGVDYTVAQLASMIQTGSVNETEVMRVVVTCGNPHEAAKIANSIAEVLPVRVSEIIDGASMVVVDRAVPVTEKVGPSISRYTFLGLIIGALITAIIIAIRAIMDDTIYNEDYVLENYDYPILAKVPNLLETHHGSGYGYYYNSDSEPNE